MSNPINQYLTTRSPESLISQEHWSTNNRFQDTLREIGGHLAISPLSSHSPNTWDERLFEIYQNDAGGYSLNDCARIGSYVRIFH